MNTKRIVSFVLTLAIVLGLCPMTFASVNEPIFEVEITVTGMEPGKSAADVTVTVSPDANYTIEAFSIIDSEWEDFSGTFGADMYYADISLTPAEGYCFTEEVDIFLYGITPYSSHIDNSGDHLSMIGKLDNRTPIDEVELTVTGMEEGKSAKDVKVSVPAGAEYIVYAPDFYDESWDEFTGTFEKEQYYANFHLVPARGCYFSYDTVVTINGEYTYDFYLDEDDSSMDLIHLLDLRTPIDEVNLTLTGMEEGKSTADVMVTAPAGAKCTVKKFSFSDSEGNDFTGTFEKDRYTANIYLAAAEGYCFSVDTNVSINGEFYGFDLNSNSIGLHYDKELRTPINKVDVTLTGMEEGKSTTDVKVTTPAGAKYTVKEFSFSDSEGNDFTGTFEKDRYTAKINLAAPEGYCFSEDTDVSINGETAYAFYVNDDYSSIDLYNLLELRTPFDKVDITITGMEKGKSTADVKVTLPANANYTLDDFQIYDGDWEPFTGTFAADLYYANIWLEPAKGYYFSEDTVATINGSDSDYFDIFGNSDLLIVNYNLELRTLIDKVEVTVTGMEKGKSATDVQVTVPADAKYSVSEYDIYDSEWEPYTGSFDKNLYAADIYLVPAEGYRFSDDTQATVNGNEPDYLNAYDDGLELNLEYYLDLRTPISHVELPAWPTAPKAGSTVPSPTTAAPQGKNYAYTGKWTRQNASLDPGDKFENDAAYFHMFTILANEGFCFADNVTITVGGEVYTGYAINDGDELFIAKTYPIGNAKLVDQINLSGAFPTAGKEPGKVTATGTGFTLEGVSWGVADNGDANNIDNPTKPFQAGEYVYLAMHIQPAEGYAFDLTGQIRFNGKVYSPIPQYSAINPDGTVTIAICLGQVRSGSSATGDFTGDNEVTDADVIYLLWHTVFAEDYPIETNADFTGDGEVTDADVIYLLWHTVFPEDYPL